MRKVWIIVAVVAALLAAGYVFRDDIREGLRPRPMKGAVAVVNGTPPKYGMMGVEFVPDKTPLTVRRVIAGTGAAEAGMQPGDVIAGVESVEHPDFPAFFRVLKTTSPGDHLHVKTLRDGKTSHLEIRLLGFAEMAVLEATSTTGPATRS